MNVLNPRLYRFMETTFGRVHVANRGAKGTVRYYREGGKRRLEIKHCEHYVVDCPVCRGIRKLWVSYAFGMLDEETGSRARHLAYCFRCHTAGTSSQLTSFLTENFSRVETLVSVPIMDKKPELSPIRLPRGVSSLLHHLPAEHQASAYLRSRGFDPAELGSEWGWEYFHECEDSYLRGRICIPIFHRSGADTILVGWQSRSIPGLSFPVDPKYYIMPGFRKSLSLYNINRAWRYDPVVVMEGVTDVARMGVRGVALFGNSMSGEQFDLLLTHCRESRVVIMMDSDADQWAYTIERQLGTGGQVRERRLGRGVFRAKLPSGDPADFTREQLEAFVEDAMGSKI